MPCSTILSGPSAAVPASVPCLQEPSSSRPSVSERSWILAQRCAREGFDQRFAPSLAAAERSCTTSVSRSGRDKAREPSDSPCTSRNALVVSGGITARRSANAASILFRTGPAGISASSKLQTRARICEAGLYAAQARKRPSSPRTSTVSPLCGAPRTRDRAEKIHGWRRRSERSRPASE